jgi:two-component system, OmpR family, phosphate regulon sensor histidine kinase PhoR
MNWWLPRVVAPLLLTGFGAFIGFVLGRSSAWLAWWVTLGAGLGFGVTVAWDTWRGQRVLRWLRDRPVLSSVEGPDEPVPIAAGLWGEAGYRIQKALRVRDQALADERAKLEQFLSAIDASPNGVTLIDQRDGIVWCNAVAGDHFAIDPRRDRAQRITNLVRDPAFFTALAVRAGAETAVFADPRRERQLSMIVREYGPGMRMLLTQDVTEAERQEAMRRHFVANVSHEIRTPLTVLAGSLETLASLPLSGPERQRMLELMKQQADRMQTLVEDLLTLARLEGSPRPAPDHWFDLDAVWQQARADATALSAGRHRLEFDIAEGTQLAGDAGEFMSLVANLVGNAIRYTPQGGRVDVRWHVTDRGEGEFVVRDTGIGIPRELIPRITERFYRVDGSRSRETGGTGLGLSIVKHVAQRLGAELLVDSEVGRGSTFRVRVAAARVRRAPDSSTPLQDAAKVAANVAASGATITRP